MVTVWDNWEVLSSSALLSRAFPTEEALFVSLPLVVVRVPPTIVVDDGESKQKKLH